MKLRWGILGCARISRRGLIPGIRASQTGTLSALASRDPRLAREWAGEFHIPTAYGRYEEVLADPEIDAVYIPLPNELHRPWAMAAADAGKHVLCEKPLALDAGEANAMAEHCRSRQEDGIACGSGTLPALLRRRHRGCGTSTGRDQVMAGRVRDVSPIVNVRQDVLP